MGYCLGMPKGRESLRGRSNPGVPTSKAALVVVHPMSLDAYADQDGDAVALAGRILDEMETHQGPVIVFGTEDYYGRPIYGGFLSQLSQRGIGIARWVRHEPWEDGRLGDWGLALARLDKTLRRMRVRSVVVAGLWWGRTGCASYVYEWLGERGFDVSSKEGLLGVEDWSPDPVP